MRSRAAVFDEALWEEDLHGMSLGAREAAAAMRARLEALGTPTDDAVFLECATEEAKGRDLPFHRKLRVPAPDGPWGMVFAPARLDGEPVWVCRAFGMRHPPKESRKLDVYDIAARRLRGPRGG